jgi:hypothetical protein
MALQLEELEQNGTNYWISQEINHGDFPFRLFVKVQPMEDYGEEVVRDLGEYYATVEAVSLEAAGTAGDSFLNDTFPDGHDGVSQEWLHIELAQHGIAATLWQKGGNDEEELTKLAHEEIKNADFLFGFYMDRPCNKVGATGWDFIKGNVYPSTDED